MFGEPIAKSTPHIYLSALSFVPSSSVIKKYYKEYRTLFINSDISEWPQMMTVLQGHNGAVSSVAYSPNGKQIVSGSEDNTIRIWEADTGNLVVGPMRGHIYSVTSVAYSSNGKYIVSGSRDKTIRIWEADTGNLLVGPIE